MNLRTFLVPVIALVLGLGVLTAVQDSGFRERIESDLTERAQGALSAAGIDGVEVELTGRDADVTAATDTEALAAADVLGDVEGIRVATAFGPQGPASADGGADDASAEDDVTTDDAATDDEATDDATDEPTDEPTEEAADDATPSPEPSESPSGTDDEADEETGEPTREEREEAQEELVEIPNITFVTDSARLTADGLDVVRDAVKVLKEHPGVEVRIEGHTDSVGTEAHNQRLSEQRATEVRHQLARLGIDKDRLTTKGFGESEPLVVPLTFADLEKNRRVEFVVLD